jgi:long-chain-fatty-acid--[acyl-carrier-protein] ligase
MANNNQNLKEALLHKSNIKDYNVLPDPNKNILNNFIDSFTKDKDEYFAWDNTSGSSKRKDFLLKSAVVSELIKSKVKGKYVGIMLPALQSTTLLIIATYMAKKIPVMFNWTVGHKVLIDTVELSNVESIFTATAFYDKIKNQIPESVAEKLIFLDKEAKNMSLKCKLLGAFKSKLPKLFLNHKNLDETGVVLFTSGSETKPKSVPLSHKNMISSLWGGLHIIDIRVNSVFLSFLPPFHSFGFTVLSILPLLTGVRVAYTPDPTKIDDVISAIKHTHANNIMVTPTFLKMIIAKAEKSDLETVELVISGAESLSASTKESFQKLTENRPLIIEGYGITECSPIVCLNPFESQKLNSVGVFIKGIEHKFINPETEKVIPDGEEGMLIVRGDSVFKGYLDDDIENPFIHIDGKKYYKTGDIAKMDEDGYVYITGRLKRFVKKGGEMISMPLIEKTLLQKYGNSNNDTLAIEGDDKDNKVRIVLFTTLDLSVQEANLYLREQGLSGIHRVTDVVKVDNIPALGNGKTDYRLLKSKVFNND